MSPCSEAHGLACQTTQISLLPAALSKTASRTLHQPPTSVLRHRFPGCQLSSDFQQTTPEFSQFLFNPEGLERGSALRKALLLTTLFGLGGIYREFHTRSWGHMCG